MIKPLKPYDPVHILLSGHITRWHPPYAAPRAFLSLDGVSLMGVDPIREAEEQREIWRRLRAKDSDVR